MARTLKLLHQLKDPADDTFLFGSGVSRTDLNIDGDVVYRSTITVEDDYNVETIWAAGDGGLTTFDQGIILSDQDVLVEMRNDAGSAEFALIQVRANTPFYFGPFLAAGTAGELVDGAESVENTDFDSIDRIQIQRNVADNVGNATVTLALVD